jgi:hypothetical protein
MASSSISLREFIYFLPHPIPPGIPIPYTPQLPNDPLNCGSPHEPTNTLVLTSPAGTFVDIRIHKPQTPEEPALPNTGGPPTRLSWAFAGRSTSRPAPEKENVRHAVWSHWVDNFHPVGATNIPKDEGDMYPLPDGREVEIGVLASPHTSELCTYEEMWKEVQIQVCEGMEEVKWCVVLRIDDVPRQTRGVVIRVGQYCQGIVKVGDQTTVERWEYALKKGVDEKYHMGDWVRVLRIGDLFVPCAVALKSAELEKGNVVTHGHMTWTVEEAVSW